MKDDDFYNRVKNTLPCNMEEWTDEQLITQWNKMKDFRKVNTEEGTKFYESMMLSLADDRNIKLTQE